jgi:Protein of unknown function (DUF3175)
MKRPGMRRSEATNVNASGALKFPHCRKGTGRESLSFFGCNGMEAKMAMHRKAARARKTTARKTIARKKTPKRWSQRVTRESDALDLKRGVFTLKDPKKIAASLKRSAERSSRRKAGAYRSALSMLTFYINRAGRTLPPTQRDRLQRAKVELRRAFGRE